MKLLHLAFVAASLLIVVAPNAAPQDNATAEPKPMRLERLTPQGNLVQWPRGRVLIKPVYN